MFVKVYKPADINSDPERLAQMLAWMQQALPGLEPNTTFQLDIRCHCGQPQEVAVHRWATRDGCKYRDPLTGEPAKLEAFWTKIDSEPFPDEQP